MTSIETQIPTKSESTPKDTNKPLQLPKTLIQAHELMIRAFKFDQRGEFPKAQSYYMQSARLFALLLKKHLQPPFFSLWNEQARLSVSRAKQLRHLQSHNKPSPSSAFTGLSPHILQQQELEANIRCSRLSPSPNLTWDHVFGLDKVIKEILDVVVPPLERPELLQGNLKVPRSVLLFGPPGCGKSLLLKVLASQINIPVISVSAANLFSKWQGESQKNIHALYTVAWEEAPSIVFIDEFDGLFSSPDQQQGNTASTSLAVQMQKELQQYMDGLKTPEINQTVTIGATNFPWHVQPSLLRRFDRILYIHPPSPSTIDKLLEHFLSGVDHTLTRKELFKLSEKFNGYTPDEIKKICEKARLRTYDTLRRGSTSYHPTKPPRALQFHDILISFSLLRPLLWKCKSEEGVGTIRFREWNQKFGSPEIIYHVQDWEATSQVSKERLEEEFGFPRGAG